MKLGNGSEHLLLTALFYFAVRADNRKAVFSVHVTSPNNGDISNVSFSRDAFQRFYNCLLSSGTCTITYTHSYYETYTNNVLQVRGSHQSNHRSANREKRTRTTFCTKTRTGKLKCENKDNDKANHELGVRPLWLCGNQACPCVYFGNVRRISYHKIDLEECSRKTQTSSAVRRLRSVPSSSASKSPSSSASKLPSSSASKSPSSSASKSPSSSASKSPSSSASKSPSGGSMSPSSGKEPPSSGSMPSSSGWEPPSSGSRPPSSGWEPPSSGSRPPSSEWEPPSSGSVPPSSGWEPPSSGSRPPSNGWEPPSSGSVPPSSGWEPPFSGSMPLSNGWEPPFSGSRPPSSGREPPSSRSTPPPSGREPPSSRSTPPPSGRDPPPSRSVSPFSGNMSSSGSSSSPSYRSGSKADAQTGVRNSSSSIRDDAKIRMIVGITLGVIFFPFYYSFRCGPLSIKMQ